MCIVGFVTSPNIHKPLSPGNGAKGGEHMNNKVTILYNGQEIQVDKQVAEYLEIERKREQAEERRDRRHLSDKDIDRNDLDNFLADRPADFVELIAKASEAETLRRALDCLTDTQRRRVQMYFFDGFTYRQIAEFENANEKSVRESITGALGKLKKSF